jgi:hypothetical protein
MPLTLPWLLGGNRRPLVTPINVQVIHFICEQDGPAERDLKALWHPLLIGSPEVTCAYLVRVSYGDDKAEHVLLALRSTGSLDTDLAFSLRAPFAAKFNREASLDIGYVSSAQESTIVQVCSPFYVAT